MSCVHAVLWRCRGEDDENVILLKHLRKVYAGGGRGAGAIGLLLRVLSYVFRCGRRASATPAAEAGGASASSTQDGNKVAVRDFTMGVKRGEIFALLGLNGAGERECCVWGVMHAVVVVCAPGYYKACDSLIELCTGPTIFHVHVLSAAFKAP